LGGVFSQAFGRRAAFLADAVSFAIAVGLFALIRGAMQQPQHQHRARMNVVGDMKEAGRYAQKDHAVLALLASKATFAIGAGTVSQLPVLATEVFHWGDAGTGLLLGARGVGSGLGPILASRLVRGSLARVLRVCGFAGLVFSVFYLAGAWAPVISLAALAIGIAHLGGGSQWTLSTYGLQMRTPDGIRGRVMAGDFAIVTLVLSISSLLAGLLSEAVGVRWTMSTFAVVAGVASSAYVAITRPIVEHVATEEAAAAEAARV
jgi:MFS family permease